MAIAVSRPIAGSFDTANASSYSMSAFTPSANSLLVVFVAVSTSALAAPTMTGGSLTWVRQVVSTGIDSLYLFYAIVGGSPVSTTITFDCTGDAGTGCIMMMAQYTGHDTTTPIRQTKNAGPTSSTNATVTFDSALLTANGYFIGWGGQLSSATNSVPPGGWTEGDDSIYSTPSRNGASAYRAGGETTAGPFTFTNSSTNWAALGVEVNVDSGGGGAPTVRQFSALGVG